MKFITIGASIIFLFYSFSIIQSSIDSCYSSMIMDTYFIRICAALGDPSHKNIEEDELAADTLIGDYDYTCSYEQGSTVRQEIINEEFFKITQQQLTAEYIKQLRKEYEQLQASWKHHESHRADARIKEQISIEFLNDIFQRSQDPIIYYEKPNPLSLYALKQSCMELSESKKNQATASSDSKAKPYTTHLKYKSKKNQLSPKSKK